MEMLALWSDKRKGCKRWRERGLAIRNGLQYEGQSFQGTVNLLPSYAGPGACEAHTAME